MNWRTTSLRRGALVAVVAASLCPGTVRAAETMAAKCIRVTDGDSIVILEDRRPVAVRLHGIDAPEPGAPFSKKAKQLLSSLALGRIVEIRGETADRHGRLVARVYAIDDDGARVDLSEVLVAAGLAWHFTRYSSRLDLAAAEERARSAGLGVWSLPNPLPPWEIDRSRLDEIVYRGNVRSRVFHAPWCKYYWCKNCTREFGSREEALAAGFRPGGHCKP